MQNFSAAYPLVFHSFQAGKARQYYVLQSNMMQRQASQPLVVLPVPEYTYFTSGLTRNTGWTSHSNVNPWQKIMLIL
ncbi:hypothetical protein [Undibacterium sp. YM2]|uniref:hypothetical protein n=1 Tax=Undibacterium sp. YM2 TaxID=2058625 RepID=UPI001389E6CD|nr:hypothetical protein [Undibacterium sp. YM2]